jgi:hypothetical protein
LLFFSIIAGGTCGVPPEATLTPTVKIFSLMLKAARPRGLSRNFCYGLITPKYLAKSFSPNKQINATKIKILVIAKIGYSPPWPRGLKSSAKNFISPPIFVPPQRGHHPHLSPGGMRSRACSYVRGISRTPRLYAVLCHACLPDPSALVKAPYRFGRI